MKRLLYIVFAAAIVACVCSCRQHNVDMSAFTSDPTIRLTSSGVTQFTYDPRTCQLSFNRTRGEFAVFNDDQTDFFVVTVDAIPTQKGHEVNGSVQWTTASSIEDHKNIALKAVKLEGDKIWLWCSDLNLGAVVRVLE